MEIVRLRCEQLPGVSVLGVGTGSSKVYLVHAHQFVGLLKGSMERTGVYRAFNAFLNSAVGAALKSSDGGELALAVRNGVLDRAMYSHRSHKYGSGGLSRFVTLDGAKEILEKLPDANAAVKSRLKDVFDSVSASFLTFSQATAEQCAKDDEEEVIEEIFDNSGFHGNFAVSSVPPERTWVETRLIYYRSMADRQIMEERLKAKDLAAAVLEEKLKVKEAEKVADKEQSEKEKALLENAHLKEKAATDAEKNMEKSDKEKALLENEHLKEKVAYEVKMKDLELANLRMQLELEKARKDMVPSRKRVSASALESGEPRPPPLRTLRANSAKGPVQSGGCAQRYWIVAYEGEVEMTLAQLAPNLSGLSSIQSARFGGLWVSLLLVEKRVRITPVARAMQDVGLAGRVWVEAFNGCDTWVGIDVPSCDAPSATSELIANYMARKQQNWALQKFPMVVVQ
jgi:hypothetical protein